MQLWLMTKQGLVSRSDISKRVAYWCLRLPAESGQRWAVYHQDTVEFLALSLALWQLGCTVCIPGDNLPATNERLQRRVSGFAGQYPASLLSYNDSPRKHQAHRSGARCQPVFRHWRSLPPARRESPSPFLKPLLRLKVSWGHWSGYGLKRSRP